METKRLGEEKEKSLQKEERSVMFGRVNVAVYKV